MRKQWWRVYGFKGTVISDGFGLRREAKAALERRVGRPVRLHQQDEPGRWMVVVDGHVYWIIRDDASRFAPGSGLEHLNERACPDCWLVHPPGDCP